MHKLWNKHRIAWKWITQIRRKGQGNSVSEATCRDASYLVFKKPEDQNLGAIVKISISHQDLVRSAIVFVNDADF